MARSLYGPAPGRAEPLTPLELYIGLMEEVKLRSRAMESYFFGQATMVHGQLTREFCFLQLRMIFEVIAIGCLVLHKHTSDTRAFDRLPHRTRSTHATGAPERPTALGHLPTFGYASSKVETTGAMLIGIHRRPFVYAANIREIGGPKSDFANDSIKICVDVRQAYLDKI